MAGILTPSMAYAWTDREVTLGPDPVALHGTLTAPDGTAPVPAVLIIAGSGPVDRDGNLPGMVNDSLKLLAHGLAELGIASLRTDKRGVSESRAAGPRELDLRFGTYVADTVAWLGVLRAEPRVARFALLGHSEGALVATLAAQRMDVAGLILISGVSEPAGKVIERQLAAAGVPEPLQQRSRQIVTALEEGRTVADVPTALASLFRPSVQPYLISWLPLDPSAELAKVRMPVLIVQGTNDLQVTVGDAHRLAAARPGASLILIEGMNHVLKQSSDARAANIATYANPGLPLASGLLPAIVAFLTR